MGVRRLIGYIDRLPDDSHTHMDAERRGQEPWDMGTELAALNVEVTSRLAVAWGGLAAPIDIPRPDHVARARGERPRESENPYADAISMLQATRRPGS